MMPTFVAAKRAAAAWTTVRVLPAKGLRTKGRALLRLQKKVNLQAGAPQRARAVPPHHRSEVACGAGQRLEEVLTRGAATSARVSAPLQLFLQRRSTK